MFVDDHKWPNLIEDRKPFLKIIWDLKPYLVEFVNESQMILTNFSINDRAEDKKGQLVNGNHL